MGILATIYYNNHQIAIDYSQLWGTTKIIYDGRVVLNKRMPISKGSHNFQVFEDGQTVYYRVDYKGWWVWTLKISVYRQGVLIYSDEPGFIPPQPPEPISERTKEIIIKEVVLVLCPHCNTRNESSNRTCQKCGASI